LKAKVEKSSEKERVCAWGGGFLQKYLREVSLIYLMDLIIIFIERHLIEIKSEEIQEYRQLIIRIFNYHNWMKEYLKGMREIIKKGSGKREKD
jgi:hypothetical protein